MHGAEIIEHHAVCTQLLCDDSIDTLVVLVALVGVGEVAVWLRTLIRRVVRSRRLRRGTLRGGRRAPSRLLFAPRRPRLSTDSRCNNTQKVFQVTLLGAA